MLVRSIGLSGGDAVARRKRAVDRLVMNGLVLFFFAEVAGAGKENKGGILWVLLGRPVGGSPGRRLSDKMATAAGGMRRPRRVVFCRSASPGGLAADDQYWL